MYASTQSYIRYSLLTDPVDPHKMLLYSWSPVCPRVSMLRLVMYLDACS